MARGARPAPFRDQHPAGDRLPIHVLRPAAGAGVGSAFDARAGAIERDHVADFCRDRTQPRAGAVAVRYRGAISKPARTARLTACRCRAIRPTSAPWTCFTPAPPATTRCFRWIPAQVTACRQRTFARPVEVQITGSILIYDLADPRGGKGEPVKALAAQFPDMRRFIREGYVRYAFTRFGVPYVVSIQCLDSAPRARRLACREAYPVAERFLKALRIAGGQPARPRLRYSFRNRRTARSGFARVHLSPERRHHRPQRRTQARRPRRLRRLFANPLSAGESPGHRQLAIVRQAQIRRAQRRISVARQFLRSPQFPGRAMRRRLRPSGPGHPPRALSCTTARAAAAAIPGSRPSSPSATAS